MSDPAPPCEDFVVQVHTSPGPTSGTFCHLWLSLVGSEAETPPTRVTQDQQLLPGSVVAVRLGPRAPVGRLLLVRLRLEPRPGLPDLAWLCGGVQVGGAFFPCHRWLQPAEGAVELRPGELCVLAAETEERLKQHRREELQSQQQLVRWRPFVDGAPQCADFSSPAELGPNLSYTFKSPEADVHYLKGFARRTEPWSSFSEMEEVFALCGLQNKIASFIKEHWREDWFFGYQCVNGCNPVQLRQINVLPPNMAVTAEMLRPFLPADSGLEAELQKGNFYLLDYEILEGIPPNTVNGKETFLSAPLCLLHLNGQKLVPIAIQLQQEPGPQNPVFLPSDAAPDWLLAKVWVLSSDFQVHQLVSHYLRTHMMSELCCVATLRQLPRAHPLHQLLMPHVRTSLQINLQARATLLAKGGVFDQAVGCGLEAIPIMLSRASSRMRYRSLCVPEDLADRGLDRLQSYYAQDARRIWEALHRFVSRWVDLYYSGDEEVQGDQELQNWISDINNHGFPQDSGFPQSFLSRAEVSKFVTMLVFSSSAQHAAVNFSQLDSALWIPNRPPYMRRPPPEAKGGVAGGGVAEGGVAEWGVAEGGVAEGGVAEGGVAEEGVAEGGVAGGGVAEAGVLSWLPEPGAACRVLMVLSMLAQPGVNYVPLCGYREAVFGVEPHRRLVADVGAELQAISDDITERNARLEAPYPYLRPAAIENSVAI
ncbi:polyunsaturated fatty acid lipoxygenase ALOX15B isoform 1-T2 [Menidia menidia]